MKAAIIANGQLTNYEFHKRVLKKVDVIIAADGGSNHCKKLKIIPNYIIGDLDSVDEKTLLYFLKKGVIVIKDTDQNKTDLQLAIDLAKEIKTKEFILLGVISTGIDHTLANILCLQKLKNAKIIDDKNEIFYVNNKIEITGKKGQIISVISLTDVSGLTYSGLKWNVNNAFTKWGWSGIRNVMTGRKASIKLKKGDILVIKSGD